MTTANHTLPAATLPRDDYGALMTASLLTLGQQSEMKQLLAKVIKAGTLPEPFATGSKTEFECLNIDPDDVWLFRGRVKALIVQARSFWKHLRKGYTRMSKRYFLVLRSGSKVEVKELDNRTCAKRAKNTTALGQLVSHYLGTKKLACRSPAAQTGIAYKVLARSDDGRLVSAYDGSEYKVGNWRVEAAKPDHGGGYYYYLNPELAVRATQEGTTFAAARTAGKRLVLCEVEVAGRRIAYDSGKRAASRLRVLRELAPLHVEGEDDADD